MFAFIVSFDTFSILAAAQGHRHDDVADPAVRLYPLGFRPDGGRGLVGLHRHHDGRRA